MRAISRLTLGFNFYEIYLKDKAILISWRRDFIELVFLEKKFVVVLTHSEQNEKWKCA